MDSHNCDTILTDLTKPPPVLKVLVDQPLSNTKESSKKQKNSLEKRHKRKIHRFMTLPEQLSQRQHLLMETSKRFLTNRTNVFETFDRHTTSLHASEEWTLSFVCFIYCTVYGFPLCLLFFPFLLCSFFTFTARQGNLMKLSLREREYMHVKIKFLNFFFHFYYL